MFRVSLNPKPLDPSVSRFLVLRVLKFFSVQVLGFFVFRVSELSALSFLAMLLEFPSLGLST